MRRLLRELRSSESGSALTEMAIVMSLVVLTLAAFVEFTFAVYVWNQATKALQYGARLASISDPVDTNMMTSPDTGTAGGPLAIGDLISGGDNTRVCSSKTQSCTNGGSYSAAAMDRLIYGSDYDGAKRCSGGDRQLGMCDIFPGLVSLGGTVEVTYTDAGLGFSGNPSGAVPVVTLTVRDLSLNLPVVGRLLGMAGLTFPAFSASSTAEDMRENT